MDRRRFLGNLPALAALPLVGALVKKKPPPEPAPKPEPEPVARRALTVSDLVIFDATFGAFPAVDLGARARAYCSAVGLDADRILLKETAP